MDSGPPRSEEEKAPSQMSRSAELDRVCRVLSDLQPVMVRRVAAALERSPETLPDEILLLESVVVLRKELCSS